MLLVTNLQDKAYTNLRLPLSLKKTVCMIMLMRLPSPAFTCKQIRRVKQLTKHKLPHPRHRLHGNLGSIDNVQLCLQRVYNTHTHTKSTQMYVCINITTFIRKCVLYILLSKDLAGMARLLLCQIPTHFGWQLLLQVTDIPRAIDDAYCVLFQVPCHVLGQTCS